MNTHRRGIDLLAHITLGLLLALGAAPRSHASGPGSQPVVASWVTSDDHVRTLSPGDSPAFGALAQLPVHIEVNGVRHQRMVGFGASLTDSSAWLMMHKLSATQREALLQELFGRDGGIGLDFTRLTIGASDFSLSHYSLDDVPRGQTDPELRHFSIQPNRGDVIPVARAALAINPQLKVMASPWSAPGWMKTTGSLIQGTLDDAHFEAFARYLVRYTEAYADAGIPIFALTVQNEPDYEPADYPGMRLGAAQRARLIGRHLGPLLEARGSRTQIFDWDHNWDKPEHPLEVLRDPVAARYVSAVAWHCYGGDVAVQSRVHDAFPDKDVYLTECSGGDWEPVKSGGLTFLAREQIIRTTRHWARGALFWNLALDERKGPYAGGCQTCRGVVTINTADGSITRNDEYYALAHASRFVRQGAWRVGSSPGSDGIDNVVFENADDHSMVMVVTNSAHVPRRFSVGHRGKVFHYTAPPRSLVTLTWSEAATVGSR
ncbi:glycoside hydrolase family 30 protein [Aerolutibacter ruishenii]|uniref:Glucosylceramidase n=1 Tax=Aerolutibacter ruishenii TaxID=686800 RepID=A0A562LSU9_9GAMM|nr:glycoside hydrolase family 30 beta sandwich domain-containing protein [Lysobacter ruishenii]TWI10633.1 glucosylceramidase [Lysobacter ruishenii]